MELRDKNVWLIGASTGIGAALVPELVREGARLAISSRNEAEMHTVAAKAGTSGASIIVKPADVTAPGALTAIEADLRATWGRIDVVIYDRRVRGRVQGATGPELLSRMVNVMAPIDPELIEMDWSVVPSLVRSVTSHHALVVLMTSIDSAGASRGLLSVLPQLTRKHTVVVASVTDPSILQASHERSNRDEVYRAAAAERAMLDTTRVSAAIRQLGADVVTGAPADLPPALADRYIALKAAGRL